LIGVLIESGQLLEKSNDRPYLIIALL